MSHNKTKAAPPTRGHYYFPPSLSSPLKNICHTQILKKYCLITTTTTSNTVEPVLIPKCGSNPLSQPLRAKHFLAPYLRNRSQSPLLLAHTIGSLMLTDVTNRPLSKLRFALLGSSLSLLNSIQDYFYLHISENSC